MKKIFVIGLTFFLSSLPIFITAQTVDENLKKIYEQETIYINGNTNKYVKNNEKKKIGLFGKKIKQEFVNSSADAQQEMEIHRKHSKRGTILLATGAVVIAAAFIAAPEITLPLYLGLTGAGFIPYTIGAIDLYKAPKHLQKAVWLHNRDIIVTKK